MCHHHVHRVNTQTGSPGPGLRNHGIEGKIQLELTIPLDGSHLVHDRHPARPLRIGSQPAANHLLRRAGGVAECRIDDRYAQTFSRIQGSVCARLIEAGPNQRRRGTCTSKVASPYRRTRFSHYDEYPWSRSPAGV